MALLVLRKLVLSVSFSVFLLSFDNAITAPICHVNERTHTLDNPGNLRFFIYFSKLIRYNKLNLNQFIKRFILEYEVLNHKCNDNIQIVYNGNLCYMTRKIMVYH